MRPNKTRKKCCITLGCGRLGNMMFGIASGYYYAKTHNLDYFYINDECHDEYVEKLKSCGLFKDICIINNYQYLSLIFHNQDYVTFHEPSAEGTIYHKFPNVYGNVVIKGLRENPRYFTKEFALDLFKPSDDLVQELREMYKDYDLSKLVSVHIRRGDYLNTANFVLQPLSYYLEVMKKFSEDLKFLIVSDDIPWCKKNLTGDRYVFADKKSSKYPSVVTDLYVMTLCQDNILSCSLFSWWGAYLNLNPNRKVYYTMPYYLFAKDFGAGIIPDDPNWIYCENPDKPQRVAVCAIAKMENIYIREWVEHHLEIGVDKIFLYDNNDIDGENFYDVIPDYIDEGRVELIDYRGKKTEDVKLSVQVQAYQDCYDRYSNSYDWIAFIDCDEFIHLEHHKNIKSFLSQSKFNEFKIVCMNWKIMDDNGLIEYDNRPCMERFTHPSTTIDAKNQNMFIKSIVRGGLTHEDVDWIKSGFSHNPIYKHNGEYNIEICCDMNGNPHPFLSWEENSHLCYEPGQIYPPNYDEGWLIHFKYKTIEEFVRFKMVRLYPDLSNEFNRKITRITDFFKINELTDAKMDKAEMLRPQYELTFNR